jgi:anti-sigma B factor antagonist
MKVDVEDRSGVSLVHVFGHLIGGDDSELLRKVTGLIDRSNARVVLDLSGVEFISSAGLGDLVRITAQANSQAARLVLASPSPFVAGVLETTRLTRFFDICPTVEAAIARLA